MSMKTNVIELKDIAQPKQLATDIAALWAKWKGARKSWELEKQEIRDYIFATDTTKTTNSTLPWKNKTTRPKLCQIRDNLHANYMAALFPNADWFKWSAGDEASADVTKAKLITNYMKNKINISGFRTTISSLVLDYIDYGNAFAEVVYVNETHETPDGVISSVYSGPKVIRISPYDIVWDITCDSFQNAPKITRRVYSLGQLFVAAQSEGWAVEALNQITDIRQRMKEFTVDQIKDSGFKVDGFGNAYDYFTSGVIEILEFEGDIFDLETNTLLTKRKIIVADRLFVLQNTPFYSWLGTSNKVHVGWRLRPDNAMAMGPLDNLVGMQYRIDHLENLKADVFDQIATPVIYQKGYVEPWEWGPNERIYGDTESDVQVLRPDSTALNADLQIQILMNDMEEMAGAPKQAMGIRTPGEKTAYEVQSLENAAGRIFQNKAQHFEEVFIEPILNQMLEVSRRYLDSQDIIRVMDDDFGVEEFIKITPDDIKASGRLYPIGARHFARNNQLIQNLNGFLSSPAYADPAVSTHISGLQVAKMFSDLLGLEDKQLVQPNIRIVESLETQRTAQTAQAVLMDSANASVDIAQDEQDAVDEGMQEGYDTV